MWTWNGCNALHIAGNPIKDINAKLSFLSWGIKCCDWPSHPVLYKGIHIRPHHHFIARLHRGKMCLACQLCYGPPLWPGYHLKCFNLDLAMTWWKIIGPPSSDIRNSTFACTLQWCMQIYYKHFPHHVRVIWKCSFTVFPNVNADLKWL